tara:strand:+ start:160 stop:1104 length:945 start_codon:yes stop_codon:yes gene_type:complete
MKLVDDDIIMKFLNVKTLGGDLEWYSGNNDYSHGGFAKKGLGYVLPKIENVDFKVLKQDESKLNLASENIDSVNIKWENNQLVWNYNNENILELEICDETLKSQLKLDNKDKAKNKPDDEEKEEKDAVTNALMKLEEPVSKPIERDLPKSGEIERMEDELSKVNEKEAEKKEINDKLKNIKTELEDKNKELEAAAKAKLFNKPPEVKKPEEEVKVETKVKEPEKEVKVEAKVKEPEKEVKVEAKPEKEVKVEAKVKEPEDEEVKPDAEVKPEEEEDKVEGNKEVQKAGRKKRKSKRRNNKRNKRKSKRKKRLLI